MDNDQRILFTSKKNIQTHIDDKFYFVPIPEDEMNRNDELIQNPGYD